MQKITDCKDREWTIEITMREVMEVYKEYKVDITNLEVFGEWANAINSFNLLYLICREQAESRGINEIEFAKSFQGEKLQGAFRALMEEYGFFSAGATQKLIMKALSKQDKMSEMMTEKVMTEMETNFGELEKALT